MLIGFTKDKDSFFSQLPKDLFKLVVEYATKRITKDISDFVAYNFACYQDKFVPNKK